MRYAEVTFTAAAHGERLGDPDMPLNAVLEGLAVGAERYGIQTRVILDHSRRRSIERLWRSLDLASRHPQVIAIGLPGRTFAEVFLAAHELAEHPLPDLVSAGLTVTLNTDGETPLTAEYQHVRETFAYSDSDSDLAGFARASVAASFAPEQLKTQLSAEIDRWL